MSRLLCGAFVLFVATLGLGASSGNFAAADPLAVVVQAPGAEARAAAAVRRLGGAVTAPLPIVSGFAATVPADAVDDLAAVPGVRAVTPDATMHPTVKKPPGGGGGGGGGGNLPKSVYRTEVGADVLAAGGATGDEVTVALIDTGIDTEVARAGDLHSRVQPVHDPNSLLGGTVDCVNFSGEPTCDDTFGHGTFLAGLIAGSGAASSGRYAGIAPAAKIVSVKVGGADGSADVSKVLAGIQWVVSFKDTYDIRVLNLSLGTDSTVHWTQDPLNLAVQRAWVEGITVVVSAGNFGAGPRGTGSDTYGTVTKPGDDPFVITVGAVDDLETEKITDDRLPAFSSWGPTAHGVAKPDIVAPGARLVSLRAPGSFVDTLPGIVDATHRRGTGTSMSAAVVSGLAAQLHQARPRWRPDDVKAALAAAAPSVASTDARAVGAGLAHGPSALSAPIEPTYRDFVESSGLGTLTGSRGTNLVSGVTGEMTAQGLPWNPVLYLVEWNAETWYASQWGTGLAGNNWQGNNWQTSTWATGNNWQGNNWQGSTWYGGKPDKRKYGTTIKGSGSYGAWD